MASAAGWGGPPGQGGRKVGYKQASQAAGRRGRQRETRKQQQLVSEARSAEDAACCQVLQKILPHRPDLPPAHCCACMNAFAVGKNILRIERRMVKGCKLELLVANLTLNLTLTKGFLKTEQLNMQKLKLKEVCLTSNFAIRPLWLFFCVFVFFC